MPARFQAGVYVHGEWQGRKGAPSRLHSSVSAAVVEAILKLVTPTDAPAGSACGNATDQDPPSAAVAEVRNLLISPGADLALRKTRIVVPPSAPSPLTSVGVAARIVGAWMPSFGPSTGLPGPLPPRSMNGPPLPLPKSRRTSTKSVCSPTTSTAGDALPHDTAEVSVSVVNHESRKLWWR